MKKKPTKNKRQTKAEKAMQLEASTRCALALAGYSRDTQIVAIAIVADFFGLKLAIAK